MKKEFIVERSGQSFVLYKGLLDMAHERGLTSLLTELIQIPTEENKRIAIVKATAVFEREGQVRTFTGYGDAAPNNVAPAMQVALLRMAETRAKARALRDGVNIGVTAFEEIGEESETGSQNAPLKQFSKSQAQRKEEEATTAEAEVDGEAAYQNAVNLFWKASAAIGVPFKSFQNSSAALQSWYMRLGTPEDGTIRVQDLIDAAEPLKAYGRAARETGTLLESGVTLAIAGQCFNPAPDTLTAISRAMWVQMANYLLDGKEQEKAS